MRKIINSIVFLGLLAFPLVNAATTKAETANQYEPDFTPGFVKDAIEEGDEFYMDANMLSDARYDIMPLRLPGKKDSINFRISNIGSVSGCIKVSPPTTEIKSSGTTVKIEVIGSRVIADSGNDKYTLYGCKKSSSSSYTDVSLDKNELIQNQINRIIIMSRAAGTLMDIKLAIDEDKALLIKSILRNMKNISEDMLNGGNKSIYWFYPENTLILYNPEVKINDETAAAIQKLARSKGLAPLTDIYPDFRTTKDTRHKLYFVDLDNAYINQLESIDDVLTLGSITQEEIYHGPEGPYNKPVQKPVYAKLPGLYE